MLTKAENELLTRVGAGTPMGELIRRYWIPAALSADLPANGDPLRVRLLGENFVAWRDRSGRVGFLDEACMHRGASLALARSEGDGLRCLYHGWKYSMEGTILETPNCETDTIKNKLRATTYPLREAGEIVWVYIGPRAKEPPFPRYQFMDVPASQRGLFHVTLDCNFVQVLEGQNDPTHAPILHQDYFDNAYGLKKGDNLNYIAKEIDVPSPAAAIEVESTAFGCQGGLIVDAVGDDGQAAKYVRLVSFVMPFMTMSPVNNWIFDVPIDDFHTSHFQVNHDPVKAFDREGYLSRHIIPTLFENGRFKYGPEARWGQDRSKMTESFVGLEGVTPADWAVINSMGTIYDRTKESLAPSDRIIIRLRRLLLEAARDLAKGVDPRMLSPEQTMELGSGHGVLKNAAEWPNVRPSHAPFRLPEEERRTPVGSA